MTSNMYRLLSAADTHIDVESSIINDITYSAGSMKGKKYTCVPSFYEDCSFFGVYDGHGGYVVAEYLKRYLHTEVNNFLRDHHDVEEALFSSFLSCDESMRTPETLLELRDIEESFGSNDTDEEDSSSSDGDEEMQQPAFACGSTATVAIIDDNTIYVANVGDSRCVLSRDHRAIDLSVDHRPDDKEETERITAAGGTVTQDGRINNSLNLSRGFGYFQFKTSVDTTQQLFTVQPYIKSISIDPEDEFLIIASKGIWNSMTSQDVIDFIHERFHDGNSDLEDICKNLIHLTLSPDDDGLGCDNMTVIIVKFHQESSLFSCQ